MNMLVICCLLSKALLPAPERVSSFRYCISWQNQDYQRMLTFKMMSSELDSLSNVFVSPRVHNETKCVMPPPRYWHGSFETLMCDKSSVPSSNLEPTPINPNGIVTVPKVTFTYDSPLGRNEEDQSFLASLRDLLKSQDSFSSIRSMDTPGLPRKCSEVCSEIEAPRQWGDASTFPYRSDDGVAWGEEENVKLNLKHFVTDKDEEGEESNSGTSTYTRGRSFSSIACCCSTSCITSSLPSKSSSPTADASSKNHDARSIVFRSNQSVQWNKRYKEMITFHEKYGHCLVPLNWPTNPSLAHWVSQSIFRLTQVLSWKTQTVLCCCN